MKVYIPQQLQLWFVTLGSEGASWTPPPAQAQPADDCQTAVTAARGPCRGVPGSGTPPRPPGAALPHGLLVSVSRGAAAGSAHAQQALMPVDMDFFWGLTADTPPQEGSFPRVPRTDRSRVSTLYQEGRTKNAQEQMTEPGELQMETPASLPLLRASRRRKQGCPPSRRHVTRVRPK